MILICIRVLQLLLYFSLVESCRFPIAPFPPQTYGKVPEAKTLLGQGFIARGALNSYKIRALLSHV